MNTLISQGLKKGLTRFEDDEKYIVYTEQNKRRNYNNPEEIVQAVGGAVAALGTVQGQLRRMTETAMELSNRQHALNQRMKEFVGPRTPAQIAAVNAQYEKLSKTLENLKDRHAQLSRAAQRRDDLRNERQAMRGDALDTLAIGAAVAAPVKLAAAGFGALERHFNAKPKLYTHSPAGSGRANDHLARHSQGLDHAAGVGQALACQIHGRTVVRAGPNEW